VSTTDIHASIEAFTKLVIHGLGHEFNGITDIAESVAGGIVATVKTTDGSTLVISVRREA
jgi:hypothetical protein